MILAMFGLGLLSGGALLLWRLSSCPVLRALGLGMGSWAARCRESRPAAPVLPTYRPHDPFEPYEPASVHAARRVA